MRERVKISDAVLPACCAIHAMRVFSHDILQGLTLSFYATPHANPPAAVWTVVSGILYLVDAEGQQAAAHPAADKGGASTKQICEATGLVFDASHTLLPTMWARDGSRGESEGCIGSGHRSAHHRGGSYWVPSCCCDNRLWHALHWHALHWHALH